MLLHPTVGRLFTAADHYEVGREKLRDFARAVQNFHPAHWDEAAAREFGYSGLLAPITFASSVASRSQRALMRTALDGYDPARLLHVEQEIHSNRPVTTGDRLTHEITVDSRRRTPDGSDLIAVAVTIRDSTGEVVQIVHTTLAGREHNTSPAVDRLAMLDLSRDLPALSSITPPMAGVDIASRRYVRHNAVPELVEGRQFPPKTVRLTRGELVHYAGVSGDINPIHWHDNAARAADLDAVAAHGMLVMGLGATCVTQWLGVPDCITGYYMRFARPVVIEACDRTEIIFRGRVESVDSATGRASVSLTAHVADNSVFGAASATVKIC